MLPAAKRRENTDVTSLKQRITKSNKHTCESTKRSKLAARAHRNRGGLHASITEERTAEDITAVFGGGRLNFVVSGTAAKARVRIDVAAYCVPARRGEPDGG